MRFIPYDRTLAKRVSDNFRDTVIEQYDYDSS